MKERIEGLQKGAIDYIFKPFVIEELMLRIKSLINNYKLKKALFENEKFASIGKLVANITHEIANPVFGIKGPLEYVRNEFKRIDVDNKNSLDEAFNYIFINLARIEDIVKNLKLLYYNKNLVKNNIDLNKFIAPILDFYQTKYKDRISFNLKILEGFIINTNEQAFNIIISNIISNAIDAITKKGVIQIIAYYLDGKPVIKIIDNGTGISKEKLRYIFDPFWTTKEIEKGLGIGLFIVKDLVTKIDWNIEVDSEPNKGTVFILREK